MSKVLVTYWSGTGCTAGVAERIGARLAAGGMQVDVKPMDANPSPAGYDAIVAGSSIRAFNWHVRAKKWMTRNATTLKRKPLAMFTVCGALSRGPEHSEEARGYTDRLLAETGLQPLDLGLFAGWCVPQKFNLLERLVFKIMKAPEGDFRDWQAIESWAASVAPKLGGAAAGS